MIKRVGVIELGAEVFGHFRGIAHADAANALHHGEIGDGHGYAEQFFGEQRNDRPHARRGFADEAAIAFPRDSFWRPVALGTTDITKEFSGIGKLQMLPSRNDYRIFARNRKTSNVGLP